MKKGVKALKKAEKEKEIVIFNCKIDRELRDKFKIKTIEEQTTMADIVIDAVKKYVKEK